jgi:hypothetical protein
LGPTPIYSFRVQLTERAVQDVDAVLFLTKSGASYGQSEKDFVLSLLRKGTIKQLIFAVTQQHVREARDQEDDPEPIWVRIEAERARLRAEIEATLNELAGENKRTTARLSPRRNSGRPTRAGGSSSRGSTDNLPSPTPGSAETRIKNVVVHHKSIFSRMNLECFSESLFERVKGKP